MYTPGKDLDSLYRGVAAQTVAKMPYISGSSKLILIPAVN
jgi:hypothetical protein